MFSRLNKITVLGIQVLAGATLFIGFYSQILSDSNLESVSIEDVDFSQPSPYVQER